MRAPEVVLIRTTISILLAALLAVPALAVPTAAAVAPEPVAAPRCQQLFVGPDIDSGVCYDLKDEECRVWLYNNFGTDTCLVATPHVLDTQPVCQQLFYGPDIDQGVCVDVGGDCMVSYYDRYGTGGGDRCYVPGPQTTAAALACVLLYEVADVSRHYLCVDPKADCPVYTKTVGWRGTTTECVVPGPAPASSDCGAACLEECSATVGTVWARAGCTVAHTPHYFDTGCLASNCRFVVASCSTEDAGLCVGQSPMDFAHCQAIVTGFELDTYVCADVGGECTAWVDYRWTQYCLTHLNA